MNSVMTVLSRLERTEALDRVVRPLRSAVHALPLGPARDVLHGLPVGHALHPALVHVPLGSWVSASLLDLTGKHEGAARVLIATGIVSAVPTAWSGAVDFADQHPEQQRVGVVHAAANSAAVVLYALSLAARRRGRGGRLLGLAGLTAVSLGGYLGGHLSYRQAAGVNHADSVEHIVAPGWHPVGVPEDFPPGRPVRKMVGDVAVLVVRDGEGTDSLRALAERCAHLSGPLSEGEIEDGCVVCPWHGSRFRLSDGHNVTGPSIAPQPVFEVRVAEGTVQVRWPETGTD